MSTLAASSNQAKYQTGNQLQLALIRRFQRQVCQLLRRHQFRTVLDVGCGEGFLARVLLDSFPGLQLTGVDASSAAVSEASRRCPEANFRAARVEELAGCGDRFDLVVCSEVLEHLADPQAALRVLRDLTESLALLTVPWEPWFALANLARGKYLRTLGNHPEHIQRWSLSGLVDEVEPWFRQSHAGISFPWILFLGTPQARADR